MAICMVHTINVSNQLSSKKWATLLWTYEKGLNTIVHVYDACRTMKEVDGARSLVLSKKSIHELWLTCEFKNTYLTLLWGMGAPYVIFWVKERTGWDNCQRRRELPKMKFFVWDLGRIIIENINNYSLYRREAWEGARAISKGGLTYEV